MERADVGPSNTAGEPVRLPRRKLPPLVDIALPAAAIGSGAMLFLAVPNIIGGSDLWSWAKAITLAASATVVSFAVNKQAIERGAPLATTGYIGAAAISIASILAVGAGLFAATFSGLVLKDVAELKLNQHGVELAEFVADRSTSVAQAGRVGPALQATTADFQVKALCEIEEACVSGRGGGRGPVARAIEERAGRSAALGEQFAEGDARRVAIIRKLNEQLAEYQSVLGNEAVDVWTRRADAQKIDARIHQLAGELGETIPLSLLAAFASELQSGVTVPGHAEAQANLSGILARHGQALASVIGGIEAAKNEAPAFPARTGVADTLDYMGHFLPVAAIAGVVELVLPIVLWSYTFWTIRWEIFKQEAARRGSDSADHPASPRQGRNDQPSDRSRAGSSENDAAIVRFPRDRSNYRPNGRGRRGPRS